MVEYKELGKNLKCYMCAGILSLEHIFEEKLIGIHSVLKVNCLKCQKITTVHTGHFGKNLSRINIVFVLGAIHSGVGQTSLNKILACADSPNMTNNVYKRYEKLVRDAMETEAKHSCKRAAIEERSLVISKVKDLCKEL